MRLCMTVPCDMNGKGCKSVYYCDEECLAEHQMFCTSYAATVRRKTPPGVLWARDARLSVIK